MPFGARVWTLGKVLVLLGALAATFLAAFGVSMRVALRASEVTVPALAGVTVNDATAALGELGLTLRVDDSRRPDERVPAGRIMLQDPAAGTRARRQRTVRVWVSTGPRTVLVPSVVGEPERTARIRLEQGEITIVATSAIKSTDYAPDTVIAQTPEPETVASQVRLLVNRGEPALTYVMPDVTGADGDRAAEALRQQGLRVAIANVPVTDKPPGTVTRQQPPAGAPVATTDVVSLEVSKLEVTKLEVGK
jgi:eukaryotic-like serine/threonine-protein kinase